MSVTASNGTSGLGQESEKNLPTVPYLSMAKQELTKEYSPSEWGPRDSSSVVDLHVQRLTQSSDTAKETLPFSLDISYGTSEKQKLDILLPDSLPRDCPIFVYIHGGYWQMLGREMSTFAAGPIYRAGGGVVAIGYDLAPQVTLDEIIEQVKKAVKYVLHLAKRRGSRGVYLCGHSAGGHLAAMMLSVDWMTEAHESCSVIKGAILVSGVFDVRPLVRTPENRNLQLSEEEAWKCSPFNHISAVCKNFRPLKVLIAVGSDESPEFRRQSTEYHQVLLEKGIKSRLLELPNEDHFTVIERLCEAEYSLTLEILQLMSLDICSPSNTATDQMHHSNGDAPAVPTVSL